MYDSQDVQQILQRALAKSNSGSFSSKELQEMAIDLGIDPATLQTAAQEWLAQREHQQRKQASKQRQRRAFMAHFIPYVAVNAFLIVINLAATPSILWFIYPLGGWGVGVAIHAWFVLSGD